jgi:glycosyltransferase involved in cell wall biosynthesis
VTGHMLLCANSSWYIYNFRLNLIKELKRQGYRVSVLAPKDEYSPFIQNEVDGFYHLNLNRSSLNPVKEFLSLLQLRRHLASIKADIILTYGPKINIYCGLVQNKHRTKQISNISGIGIIKSKALIFQKALFFLYRLAFKSSNFTFFQNQEDMNEFITQGITTEQNSKRIMGSGVDLEMFQKQEFPKTDKIKIAYIGRLLKSKGIQDLISAVKRVRKTNSKLELHVYGSTDPGNKDSINLVDFNSNENIIFHGHSNNIKQALKDNHIVSLPSYYGEGIPRSLIEALASGRMIITTNHPGCRDTVVEGKMDSCASQKILKV